MNIWKAGDQPCDVVVFGAHPDDAELFCGGTIAKLVGAGQRVTVVDLTRGELSSNGSVESRRKETQGASEVLGLQGRINLERADGDLYRDEHLVEALVKALRITRPRLIVGPPSPCRHPDHQALHEALNKAHFFCGLAKHLPELPAIPQPKHLQHLEMADRPADLLIDISEQWEIRLKALQCYGTQFQPKLGSTPTFINSGFVEELEARHRQWGKSIGVAFAEPFLCDQPPHLNLPTDLC